MMRFLRSVCPLRRAALLPALAIAATGCRFDLVEPKLEPPRETHLGVAIQRSEHSDGIDFSAFLDPGTRDDGLTRTLDDESFLLDGTAIPLVELRSDGIRLYELHDLRPGPHPSVEPLRIRSPGVEGIAEPPPELAIALLEIYAPDTLVTTRSAEITIDIGGLGAGTIGRGIDGELLSETEAAGSWTLLVLPDSGLNSVRFEGRAIPDGPLRFAASALPAEFVTGRLAIRLEVAQVLGSTGGGYLISVNRQVLRDVPLRIRD
jgi:hypothetical protein